MLFFRRPQGYTWLQALHASALFQLFGHPVSPAQARKKFPRFPVVNTARVGIAEAAALILSHLYGRQAGYCLGYGLLIMIVALAKDFVGFRVTHFGESNGEDVE